MHLFLYVLVSGSHFLCVWVLLVEYRGWIRREMPPCYSSCAMPVRLVLPVECSLAGRSWYVTRAQFLVRQWMHVLQQYLALLDELHTFSSSMWTQILRCFFSVLLQNGEVCSVNDSVCSPVAHCSHLESGQFFYEAHVLGSPVMMEGFFCRIFLDSPVRG